MADGCIIAPDIRCDPGVRPFSTKATGTSPSDSISDWSSARSCISRFAHASPAGPPPTMTTPTSMRSSSGSVIPATNSFSDSTGGGYSIGATPMARLTALLRLDRVSQLGDDLVQVAHDAEVRELEDRRVLVLVDREDVLRALHADLVLDRAGDAEREVELRRDRLARLADLRGVRVPAGVDDRPRRRNRSPQRVRQRLGQLLEALGLAQAAAAADQDVGVLDVHVAAALLAARSHLGPGRPGRQLDVHVGDLCVARAHLGDLEGVQAADDDARRALVAHVRD